jgi:two-component system, cell cycle sensor histidine kinase and response regulator CckA
MSFDISAENLKKFKELSSSLDLSKGDTLNNVLHDYFGFLAQKQSKSESEKNEDRLPGNGNYNQNEDTYEQEGLSREKADEVIRKSEERFKQLIKSVTDYIYTVKIENGHPVSTYHGPSCITVTGYTSEEYQNDPYLWFRMIFDEDRQKVVDQAKQLMAGESVLPIEHRLIHKDGTIRWVRSTLVMGYDENDEMAFYDGLVTDITERKKAEEALRESEQNLQRIFNQLPIGAAVVSLSFYFIKVNTMFADMMQYSNEELQKMTFKDITHPDHVENDIREIKRLITGEINSYITDKRYIRKDGKAIWCHLSVQAVRDNFNNPIHFSAMVENITDKKIAEELLKESEDKYRTIIEQTSDGIFVNDKEFRFIDANSGGCKLLEYSKSELLERNILEMMMPGDRDFTPVQINRLIKGESIIVERELKKRNGEYVLTELNIKYMPNERYFIFARDISERKKMEQEHLKLHNLESLGILAGGIAHDFNNILSTILGRTSLVLEDLPEGNMKMNLLSVEKATKKAANLANQLLTFAKGGSPLKKRIDIRKIIQDSASTIISDSKIKLEYNFTDSLESEADPSQITQVIQNIIQNSKEAISGDGKIFVSVQNYIDSGGRLFLKIIIKDTGIGIPKELLNKIFDPYFTTKPASNGLGLSVVFSIIRRHEGHIFVESEEGIGTTFEILLPAIQSVTEKKSETTDQKKKHYNILILDDEEEVREILSAILQKLHHTVVQTSVGEEAICAYELARESGKPFDMVILDMVIKDGLNGAETFKKLKEYDPDIKAIVSSGFSERALMNYKEDGFAGMLKKPYTKKELDKIINQVLG